MTRQQLNEIRGRCVYRIEISGELEDCVSAKEGILLLDEVERLRKRERAMKKAIFKAREQCQTCVYLRTYCAEHDNFSCRKFDCERFGGEDK